ncbi:MAG: phosphoribosylglycinamide formyltransferase [Planctomycetota bacterium]|jgi:formyltetrahydrofolate-dependent phosphoribosylglycinamide formyltransferase|nr:phosphoribosylglycinamide formyltransferase [Planctomycetota bacterium]
MSGYLKLAVLISGGGSTLANLVDWWDQGRLLGKVELVISSRPGAKGLQVAAKAGIPSAVVDSDKYRLSAREGEEICDWASMSEEIDKLIAGKDFDLVCMAGWLCRYQIHDKLLGRVINIHPALIPMFCGQGMYGRRVHEAVAASGVRVTGCTVHFADNLYDHGPIILQRCCPVFSGDLPEELAARVFAEECVAYPTAINLFAEGRVHYRQGMPAHVDGDHEIDRFGFESHDD